jgi:hypothetical protein
MFHNPMGLHGLLQGWLYLTFYSFITGELMEVGSTHHSYLPAVSEGLGPHADQP